MGGNDAGPELTIGDLSHGRLAHPFVRPLHVGNDHINLSAGAFAVRVPPDRKKDMSELSEFVNRVSTAAAPFPEETVLSEAAQTKIFGLLLLKKKKNKKEKNTNNEILEKFNMTLASGGIIAPLVHQGILYYY